MGSDQREEPTIQDFLDVGLSESAARGAAAGLAQGVYLSFSDAATSAAMFGGNAGGHGSFSCERVDRAVIERKSARFDRAPVQEDSSPAEQPSVSLAVPTVGSGLRERLRGAMESFYGSATDAAVAGRLRTLASEAAKDGRSLPQAVTREVATLQTLSAHRTIAADREAQHRDGAAVSAAVPKPAVDLTEADIDRAIADAFGRQAPDLFQTSEDNHGSEEDQDRRG